MKEIREQSTFEWRYRKKRPESVFDQCRTTSYWQKYSKVGIFCVVIFFTSYHWAGVSNVFNPFPHTTILQTTLNIFCQKMENPYNWKDNLWLKVENIVAKGEITHFEQFCLWPQCFQKSSSAIVSKCVCRLERVNSNWSRRLWNHVCENMEMEVRLLYCVQTL